MTVIDVDSPDSLLFRGQRYPCVLGRGGIVVQKCEGDGGTPIGDFPLRRILFRADRLPEPGSRLSVGPLGPADGWCDAPGDPAYNRPVQLPYQASAETLWRADHLYDLIVVLGYNDQPVVPDRGSAIFMHVARDDFGPTEGCVALKLEDLSEILSDCGSETRLRVKMPT